VLGVSEITIRAETGKLDAVADRVVAIVSGVGGSATKGVPDAGRLSILVDLSADRESEFRNAIAAIAGAKLVSTGPATAAQPPTTTPASSVCAEAMVKKSAKDRGKKKSLVVQIVKKK